MSSAYFVIARETGGQKTHQPAWPEPLGSRLTGQTGWCEKRQQKWSRSAPSRDESDTIRSRFVSPARLWQEQRTSPPRREERALRRKHQSSLSWCSRKITKTWTETDFYCFIIHHVNKYSTQSTKLTLIILINDAGKFLHPLEVSIILYK